MTLSFLHISILAARLNAPTAVLPPPVPARKPSLPSEDIIEVDDDLKIIAESARNQLNNEGIGNQFEVLTVVLRREGEGGGSVGITLAGGADYEVKEITVITKFCVFNEYFIRLNNEICCNFSQYF